MTRFLSHIDAIFFGRKSFELVCPMGPNAYPNLTRYVFSRSLKSAEGAIMISDDVKRNVEKIKRMKGKDIWLFGGAELTNSLLDLGLIDELQLSVHPVILGGGKPLFRSTNKRTGLKLVATKKYSTGLVQMFYTFGRK
jgi:dihydrofolate reductase